MNPISIDKPFKLKPKMDYASTSDNHNFHRRTPTPHLCFTFGKYILSEENKVLDVIFIAGDFFDRPTQVGSNDFLTVVKLIGDILNFCFRYNIKLRILKGTPGHDWDQNKIFERFNKLRENPIDLKYFEVLDVEYMEEFDRHILYIPDEWCNDHDLLEKQIEEKFQEKGITQVDLCFAHGFFQYQLAGIPHKGFAFKEEYFLKIVKDYVHFGHVHLHSDYAGKIISNSSHDRLAHGEEGPKGYVRVIDNIWTFIENKDAYIYKTIPVTKKETIQSLTKKITKYPENSYIRLKLDKDHPFNLNFTELRIQFADYNLEKKTNDAFDTNVSTYIINEGVEEFKSFDFINADIQTLVYEDIVSRRSLSDSAKEKLKDVLKIFKGAEAKKEDFSE